MSAIHARPRARPRASSNRRHGACMHSGRRHADAARRTVTITVCSSRAIDTSGRLLLVERPTERHRSVRDHVRVARLLRFRAVTRRVRCVSFRYAPPTALAARRCGAHIVASALYARALRASSSAGVTRSDSRTRRPSSLASTGASAALPERLQRPPSGARRALEPAGAADARRSRRLQRDLAWAARALMCSETAARACAALSAARRSSPPMAMRTESGRARTRG